MYYNNGGSHFFGDPSKILRLVGEVRRIHGINPDINSDYHLFPISAEHFTMEKSAYWRYQNRNPIHYFIFYLFGW